MQHSGSDAASTAPTADDAATQAGAESPGSLRFETKVAAAAVAAHFRNVTATAKTEAELSVASLTAVTAAAVTCLLLVVTAWLCLVAAAAWVAVDSGLSVAAALLIAAAIHVAAVLALFLWCKGLLRNVGFARTRQLLFPDAGKSAGSR
jgi:hypothetical protein